MRPETSDPAPIGVVFTRGPEHRLAHRGAVHRNTFGDRPPGRTVREAFPASRGPAAATRASLRARPRRSPPYPATRPTPVRWAAGPGSITLYGSAQARTARPSAGTGAITPGARPTGARAGTTASADGAGTRRRGIPPGLAELGTSPPSAVSCATSASGTGRDRRRWTRAAARGPSTWPRCGATTPAHPPCPSARAKEWTNPRGAPREPEGTCGAGPGPAVRGRRRSGRWRQDGERGAPSM